jgi:hypothetical protein
VINVKLYVKHVKKNIVKIVLMVIFAKIAINKL